MESDSAISACAPDRTFSGAARAAKRAQTPIGDPDDDDWEDDGDVDDDDDEDDDDDDEEPMQLRLASRGRRTAILGPPLRNITRYGLPLPEPRRSAH